MWRRTRPGPWRRRTIWRGLGACCIISRKRSGLSPWTFTRSCRMNKEWQGGLLEAGTKIQPGAQLFPRIDTKKKTEKKMENATEQKPAAAPQAAGADLSGPAPCGTVHLRVGKIVDELR